MHSVIVSVLCGPERHEWICPQLSTMLVNMALDQRFAVQLEWSYGGRPIDHVRNKIVASARAKKADWLVMNDNGIAPTCSPLDLIASAPDEVSIVGMGAGINDGRLRWNIETPAKPANIAGFQEVNAVGTGCFLIRSRVWEAIPGPWFRHVTSNDELLSPEGGTGEDIYFCKLARKHGFRVWTHGTALAGHVRMCDLTDLVVRAGAR